MSKWDNKFILLLDNKKRLVRKDMDHHDETRTLQIKIDSNDPSDPTYDKYEVRFNKNNYTLMEEKAKNIMLAILKSVNAGETEIALAMNHLDFIINNIKDTINVEDQLNG